MRSMVLERTLVMIDFLKFVADIGAELFALFEHAKSGVSDPEKERELAMAITRKAIDLQAKNEING